MTLDAELMCFTIGNPDVSNLLRLNINKSPKGVNAKEWLNVLCDLITESFSASYGVHKVLLETLDESFKEHGVYNGSDDYPTWNYIKWKLEAKLEKTNGRESTWLESALRIAHVLTFGNYGKVLNYKGKDSISIEELLNKKVIFELNSLGNIEKKFFCEFLLTYIFKLKKTGLNRLDSGFNHAILVDEAHNVFLKDKTKFVNESVTDVIYREMREYGTSLICLDQHISKISDTVKGNSACHIAFQQQLPQDIWEISGLMQMNERKDFFSKLPVGTAIVRLSERHTSPFLIEVPKVGLRQNEVKDKDIKQRMKFIFEGKKDLQANDEFGKTVRGENVEEVKQVQEVEDNGEIDERIPKLETQNVDRIRQEIIEKRKISKEENWPKLDEDKARVPTHAQYDGEFENVERNKDFLEQNKLIAKDRVTSVLCKDEIENTESEDLEVVSDIEVSDEVLVKTETLNNDLTEIQKALCGFVESRLDLGESIINIEQVMNNYVCTGKYSLEDVAKAVNHAIEQKIKGRNVTTGEKQNLYKDENGSFSTQLIVKDSKELDEAQERLFAFLQANPEHNLSTVDVYKQVGLSARKGTKIRNELIEKGLVIIKEQRYNKGWKKIMQLA